MRFCEQKPSWSSYSKVNALREQDDDEIASEQDGVNQFFFFTWLIDELWTTNKLWIAERRGILKGPNLDELDALEQSRRCTSPNISTLIGAKHALQKVTLPRSFTFALFFRVLEFG